MNPRDPRLLLIAGGVIAAIVLFLVLRPSDDANPSTTDTVAGPTATQAETTTAAETDTTSTVDVTAAPPEPEPTIAVTVRGGQPVGGLARATVHQGDDVVVVVDADASDEVHVHGYDLTADVAPGKPARIEFEATIAGGFEIELEDADVHVADLEVQP